MVTISITMVNFYTGVCILSLLLGYLLLMFIEKYKSKDDKIPIFYEILFIFFIGYIWINCIAAIINNIE